MTQHGDGSLDSKGAGMMRAFLKSLLTGLPSCFFAITGSTMVLLLLSIAAMPVNGTSILSNACPISLPAEHGSELLDIIWKNLQQESAKPLPDYFRQEAPQLPGCLTMTAREWPYSPAKSAKLFLGQWVAHTLIAEVCPLCVLLVLQ